MGALLVEYDFGSLPALTSTDIVAVMRHVGVSESAARSALSRTVKRGTLALHRRDGDITYGLTEEARKTQAPKLHSVVMFGAEAKAWDGMWSACMFTVPETRRDARQRFRTGLTELGYGQIVDGVWLAPWDRHAETRRLGELHSIDLLLIRGPVDLGGTLDPLAGFPLDELRSLYNEFLQTYGPRQTADSTGGPGSDSALTVRTRALRDWRRIAAADPHLPLDVLPDDWPRASAYRLFRSIWDGLEPDALEELRTILRVTNQSVARTLASSSETRGESIAPSSLAGSGDGETRPVGDTER